jgi:cytochrome c oxidase subunit III
MTDTHAPHDDHAHDHPEWLAHHFDDAEQQFDAGKLGMWLFLVTEILFFSGMFCAYAQYRARNPEIYEFASQFLNEKLGAINTGVLLFSSLTMAWAVRAAQLAQHRLLIGLLGATLGCAAVFLGVKTVEYTHKWNLGLLPGRFYVTQGVGLETHSDFWLNTLCVIPAILLILCAVWYLVSLTKSNPVSRLVAGPLLLACFSFFGGVYLGQYLEADASHGDHAAAHDDHGPGHDHHDEADRKEAKSDEKTKTTSAPTAAAPAAMLVSTTTPTGQAFPDQVFVDPKFANVPYPAVNQRGKAGLFFGIYYCMTGVHAVHIIGGMVVISWLIWKAARQEFHSKYFGPVDNVGLYWHLVDFIWIYLFPLLYLIK